MELRKFIREILEESGIVIGQTIWSAVVIEDQTEINKITEFIKEKEYIPAGWNIPSDYHMTISLGPLPGSLRNRGDLNKPVELTLVTIGISDKAIAFGTYGYYSKNEIPHITIAFNPANGGQPKDAKSIENWTKIDNIKVSGMIRNLDWKTEKPIIERTTGTTFGTASREAWAGATFFPDPEDYDQYGNNIEDTQK
jgi:hypothetical protein